MRQRSPWWRQEVGSGSPARPPGRRAARRRRLGTAAGGGVLLGVVLSIWLARGARTGFSPAAVAVCNAPTALECAFAGDSGIAQILTADLGRTLHQGQTVDGWTVTVRRVYADANRLVVAYAVDGPDLARFVAPAGPARAELAGIALSEDGRWGGRKAGVVAEVAWFDVSARPALPAELTVRFTVPALQVAAPPAAAMTDSRPQLGGGPPVATATVVPLGSGAADSGATSPPGPGPFIFDLWVPMDARVREARLDLVAPAVTMTPAPTSTEALALRLPGQAPPVPTALAVQPPPAAAPLAGAAGRATLQRVVVTASETRLYLRDAPLAGDGCQAELQAGAVESTRNSGACRCRTLPDGQTVCGFGAALLQAPGAWTFTLAGRWTFHFPMP